MQKYLETSIVREFDDTGHECIAYVLPEEGTEIIRRSDATTTYAYVFDTARFLKGAFMPAGYPLSVSSDYLRYQIYNALQAFCSSLTGLIASRAVLEGHGVGNASASATNALLLTIMQDIASRFTTIFSAYYLGTSLFPEAKTYRLLADVLNDAAFILDTLSPYSSSFTLGFDFISCRALVLCLSGSLRALCGLVAGGSKAALTMHFAQPRDANSVGDIGDLNAKDGSKETVLALFGMLCGSALIPYLRDAYATYAALATLVVTHLLLNYIGVRGVVMRSLNRQRTGILWSAFRSRHDGDDKSSAHILTPAQVAVEEYIFANPSYLYRTTEKGGRHASGFCTMGVSLANLLHGHNPRRSAWTVSSWGYKMQAPSIEVDSLAELLQIQNDEKYILWVGTRSRPGFPEIVVVFKEEHGLSDHLRAWLHATELTCCLPTQNAKYKTRDIMEAVRVSKKAVQSYLPHFLERVQSAGWDLDAPGSGFVTVSPRTIRIEEGDRKER